MKTKLLVVSFLALALLAACARATPTPTPAPAPGAPTPTTPTPRATPTPPPATPTALVPTGELRIGMGYLGVEVMDPSLGPGSGTKNFTPMYDYLVGVTPEAQFAKELGLARDWEVRHGANSSTYTFYLRQGVKFQNGEEVTAEDVKFSLEYFMRPASVSTSAGLLRAIIDRIETPERYKAVVLTKKPYPFLLYDLSRINYAEGQVVPKKYIEQVGEKEFNVKPIGSGPYRLKEQVVGSYMRFEAVEGEHWLYGVPKYKTVTFFLVPEETTRIAMLKTGQADVIEVSRELVKGLTGFKSFLKPGAEVVFVWMGNLWQADTYTYDKRVREALNLAVNREQIRDFVFEGQGEIVANGYYGSWALDFKAFPLYPYDPERAKALLKEAFPGGVSLTINSYNRPGVSELMRMNEAIAGFWEKVGVKTKILPMEYGTHRAKQQRGDLANTVAGMVTGNRLVWPGAWRAVLHSKGTLPLHKDPKLDALIEAIEAETELDKIAQRQWEAARYVRENHFVVPILETGSLFAGNPKKVAEWNLGKLIFDYNFQDLFYRRKAGG